MVAKSLSLQIGFFYYFIRLDLSDLTFFSFVSVVIIATWMGNTLVESHHYMYNCISLDQSLCQEQWRM
jgi:hypothetical protein